MKINKKTKAIIKCILIMVVYTIIFKGLGFISFSDNNDYLDLLISYLIMIILLISYLYFTKKLKLIKFEKKNFFKGLLIGLPLIIISIINFINTYSSTIKEGYEFLPTIKIVIFIMAILIGTGFTEEMLFRGIILNELFDVYGRDTKKNVIVSIIISSVLFGSIHLLNSFITDFNTAFYQSLQVIGMGLVYAAIYSRCRSIFSVMFIHGFLDVCNNVKSGLFGLEKMLVSIDTSHGKGLVAVIMFYCIYIPIFLYLMRNKKSNEYLDVKNS